MQETTYADWGRRIRERREGLGFTQERLAELLESDQSVISRLERGHLHPSDHLKWRVAGALGTTIETLFPYPNVRPPFPDQPLTITELA